MSPRVYAFALLVAGFCLPCCASQTTQPPDSQAIRQSRGYAGVGMVIGELDNQVVVVALLPGGPADKAGIRAGDVIIAVDARPTYLMRTEDVARLLKGPRGTQVSILIIRGGTHRLKFSVTRERLSQPGASPGRETNSEALTATPASSTDATLQAQSSSASGGEDAWKPDGQVGDLQFNVPDGWQQVETKGGTALVPNGLARNSMVVIGFLPAQPLDGDPRIWFRGAWSNFKAQLNLIDPGEPEAKRHPNGFEVLSSYSRAYTSSLGNATFILSAAIAGSRVAPYYYLCNTNCGYDGYEQAFHDFELGLTLASLGSTAPKTAGPGTAGGLKGLYVTFKTTEGDVTLGTFKVRGSTAFLAFFPDGNVIRYLPKEGLRNFDFHAAVRKTRESCGRYRMDGKRITITWGDSSAAIAMTDGAKLRMGDDPFEYEPVSSSGSLSLDGTYHPEGADPRSYIRFTSDGQFSENGVLTALDYAPAGALPGSGSYSVEENTLTLSYRDGRNIPISFFVFADEAGAPQPRTIHLNNHALLRGARD